VDALSIVEQPAPRAAACAGDTILTQKDVFDFSSKLLDGGYGLQQLACAIKLAGTLLESYDTQLECASRRSQKEAEAR
jgi:hypothetical protein